MNKREQVRFQREIAALNLVRFAPGHSGEVTDEEETAAYELLGRCIRYALADVRQWERDNDARRYSQAQSEHAEKLLNARRKRLNDELAAYGVEMCNFGLYPCLVIAGTAHRCPQLSRAQLYFFD